MKLQKYIDRLNNNDHLLTNIKLGANFIRDEGIKAIAQTLSNNSATIEDY